MKYLNVTLKHVALLVARSLRYAALLMACVVVAAWAPPITCGQSFAPTRPQSSLDVSDKRVNLTMNNVPIKTVLAALSSRAGVPIGFEVSQPEEGATQRKISVSLRDGTVSGALDMIVQADPQYKWELIRGVINIYPKESQYSISDVVVGYFHLQDGDAEDVPRAVLDLTEVKSHINSTGILAKKSTEYDGPARELPRFSLTFHNVSIRELLNEIVRKGYSNFWTIVTYWDRKKYVALWL